MTSCAAINRAGAVTVLLDYEGKDGWVREQLEGEQQPTHIVSAVPNGGMGCLA